MREVRALAIAENGSFNMNRVKKVVREWKRNGGKWLRASLEERERERDEFRTREYASSSVETADVLHDVHLDCFEDEVGGVESSRFGDVDFAFDDEFLQHMGGFDSP